MGPQSPPISPPSPASILKGTSKRSLNHDHHHSNKASIKFCDEVQVVETIHLNNFTRQEIYAYWFNKDEYHVMRQEIRHTLQMFNDLVDASSSTSFTLRGLEHKLPKNNNLKARVRSDAMNIVLDEQDIQIDLGVHNESMIRSVYRMYSQRCELAAYKRGLEDEIAVFTTHHHTKISSEQRTTAIARETSKPHVMVPTAA